jgi:hypothetical protein
MATSHMRSNACCRLRFWWRVISSPTATVVRRRNRPKERPRPVRIPQIDLGGDDGFLAIDEREPLWSGHEIATVQTTAIDKVGLIRLTTTLAHSSGEWLSSRTAASSFAPASAKGPCGDRSNSKSNSAKWSHPPARFTTLNRNLPTEQYVGRSGPSHRRNPKGICSTAGLKSDSGPRTPVRRND